METFSGDNERVETAAGFPQIHGSGLIEIMSEELKNGSYSFFLTLSLSKIRLFIAWLDLNPFEGFLLPICMDDFAAEVRYGDRSHRCFPTCFLRIASAEV